MDESSSSFNTDNSMISKETTLSTSFESQCPISLDLKNEIIRSVIIGLNEIITENKQNNEEKYIINDLFYLPRIPNISLADYIKRIVKYTKMDISSLILSVIYIDNVCETHKYILTLNNIYRMILASCLLSIKFNEDIMVNTKTYSEIAGVSVEDLNNLEYQMYVMLGFRLYVKYEHYQKYFEYFAKNIKKENYSNKYDSEG